MFIVTGSMYIVFIPFIIFTIPSDIDENNEATSKLVKDGDQMESSQVSIVHEISYYDVLTDPLILLIQTALIIVSIAYQYYEPVLSFRLQDFTDSVVIQGSVKSCNLKDKTGS